MCIKVFKKDKLTVEIFETRREMGAKAAEDIAKTLKELLSKKDTVNIVFAAAPSQNEVLENLCKKELEWNRCNAFHMDEYEGLDKYHPQSFGCFLNEHIFSKLPFKTVNYISDYGIEYEKLLKENHIDVVVLGIGENGHIAFNDPGVADFNDPKLIKRAKLDDVCRQQQVNDGCFPTFDDVPQYALTLTIPQMVSADYMFCVVPAETKRQAVYRTVNEEINDGCPATILRKHNATVLYCDSLSGADFIID